MARHLLGANKIDLPSDRFPLFGSIKIMVADSCDNPVNDILTRTSTMLLNHGGSRGIYAEITHKRPGMLSRWCLARASPSDHLMEGGCERFVSKRLTDDDARRVARVTLVGRATDKDHGHFAEAPVNFADGGRAGAFDQSHIGRDQVRSTLKSETYRVGFGHCYLEGRGPFILQQILDRHRDQRLILDNQNMTHTRYPT